MEWLINWVIVGMSRTLQSKKDMLLSRKPGAVTPNEPKIIWVPALYCNADFQQETVGDLTPEEKPLHSGCQLIAGPG